MLSEAMFSNLKRAFFIAVCLSAIGCMTNSPQNAQTNMRELTHPNGLSVKLDEKYSARQTDQGFIIEPADGSNQNVRVPVEINVSLVQNIPDQNDNALKTKEFGSRKINYKIEKNEGGSGGELYEFKGFEKVSGGIIEYSQTEQSKYSEPDFQTLWKTIENTSLKK